MIRPVGVDVRPTGVCRIIRPAPVVAVLGDCTLVEDLTSLIARAQQYGNDRTAGHSVHIVRRRPRIIDGLREIKHVVRRLLFEERQHCNYPIGAKRRESLDSSAIGCRGFERHPHRQDLVAGLVIQHRQGDVLDVALALRAARPPVPPEPPATTARRELPMIAITTNNSMSVKPPDDRTAHFDLAILPRAIPALHIHLPLTSIVALRASWQLQGTDSHRPPTLRASRQATHDQSHCHQTPAHGSGTTPAPTPAPKFCKLNVPLEDVVAIVLPPGL